MNYNEFNRIMALDESAFYQEFPGAVWLATAWAELHPNPDGPENSPFNQVKQRAASNPANGLMYLEQDLAAKGKLRPATAPGNILTVPVNQVVSDSANFEANKAEFFRLCGIDPATANEGGTVALCGYPVTATPSAPIQNYEAIQAEFFRLCGITQESRPTEPHDTKLTA